LRCTQLLYLLEIDLHCMALLIRRRWLKKKCRRHLTRECLLKYSACASCPDINKWLGVCRNMIQTTRCKFSSPRKLESLRTRQHSVLLGLSSCLNMQTCESSVRYIYRTEETKDPEHGAQQTTSHHTYGSCLADCPGVLHTS
jgi:hypothetical protein